MTAFSWQIELENSIRKTFVAIITLKAIDENKYNHLKFTENVFFEKVKELNELCLKKTNFQDQLSNQINGMEKAFNSFISTKKDGKEEEKETKVAYEIKTIKGKIGEKKEEISLLTNKQVLAEQKFNELLACKNNITLIEIERELLINTIAKQKIMEEISQKEEERRKLNKNLFDLMKTLEILKNLQETSNEEIIKARFSQVTVLQQIIKESLAENDALLGRLNSDLQDTLSSKREEHLRKEEKLEKIELLKQKSNEQSYLIINHQRNAQKELETLEEELEKLQKRFGKIDLDYERENDELKLLKTQLSDAKDIYSSGLSTFDLQINTLSQQISKLLEKEKKLLEKTIKDETIFQINLLLLRRRSPNISQFESKESILEKIQKIDSSHVLHKILPLRLDLKRELGPKEISLVDDLKLCFNTQ